MSINICQNIIYALKTKFNIWTVIPGRKLRKSSKIQIDVLYCCLYSKAWVPFFIYKRLNSIALCARRRTTLSIQFNWLLPRPALNYITKDKVIPYGNGCMRLVHDIFFLLSFHGLGNH